MEKKKLYEKTWFIIVMLLFVFPVGLFLMWKYSSWNKVAKIIVTILIVLAAIVGFASPSDESTTKPADKPKTEQEQSVDKDVQKTEKKQPIDENAQKETEKADTVTEEKSKKEEVEKTPLENAQDMGFNWFNMIDWDTVFKYKCKVHYINGLSCKEVTDDNLKEYGKYVAIAPADLQNGFGAEFKSHVYIFMDKDGIVKHVFYDEADGSSREIPLDSIGVTGF